MKQPLVLVSAALVLVVSTTASAANIAYKATLNGKQETPANPSTATGTATLQFNDNNNKLSGTVTLTGIGATQAQHIHAGECGVAGAIAVTLAAPAANVITLNPTTLTTQQATDLAAGKLYVNVHTASYTDGEIRGQIYPMASAVVCNGPNDGGAPDDAGKEGGATDSGASGSSGTSGVSTKPSNPSGSNGATTMPAEDAGNDNGGGGDDGGGGGCATAPDESHGGLAMAGLAVLGVAVLSRARGDREKRRS
jgi:uncharacterized protein (TIGR03382 family)